MFNIYYEIHISVLTLLKLENERCQKEEPLNLILVEPSEVKILAYSVRLC